MNKKTSKYWGVCYTASIKQYEESKIRNVLNHTQHGAAVMVIPVTKFGRAKWFKNDCRLEHEKPQCMLTGSNLEYNLGKP